MKRMYSIIGIIIVAVLLITVSIAVGCSANRNDFNVSGEENKNILPGYISDVNEIEKLVTDDEKLVINYFDAYTWVVYTDSADNVERMTYIYDFESSEKANEMESARCEELRKNRTMTIIRSRAIGKYVVVDLKDTSFNNVNRSILENNFAGLVIYY